MLMPVKQVVIQKCLVRNCDQGIFQYPHNEFYPLEGLLTELRYLYDFAYDTPRVLQISGRGIVGSLISFKAMFISSAVFWEDRYSSTCSPGIYSPLQAQGTRSNSSALLKYLRVWYSEERLIMDNY